MVKTPLYDNESRNNEPTLVITRYYDKYDDEKSKERNNDTMLVKVRNTVVKTRNYIEFSPSWFRVISCFRCFDLYVCRDGPNRTPCKYMSLS